MIMTPPTAFRSFRLPLAFVLLSTALPILSHHCPGQAMERHIETFTMPMEDWTRIPAVVRDDHRQLYKKCLEGLASGKVERIDRIGGAVGKTPFRFNTSQLLPRASTFVLKDGKLEASEITNESVGSRFESGPIKVDGKAALGIRYDRIPPSIGAAAMLGRGSRDDIKTSEIPVLEPIRLSTAVPGDLPGTHLMGIVPVPAMGAKATKLALIFHTGGAEEPDAAATGGMVEFLLLRGTSGAAEGEAPQRIKALLGQRGSLEAAAALRTMPDAKGYVTGETTWTYPTSAELLGGIVVPQALDVLGQGTILEMRCLAMDEAGMEIQFLFEHHLAKPEFPVASGRGDTLLTPDNVQIFSIAHQAKLTLILGVWTTVAEIPLGTILGSANRSAKDQSCYLFARAKTSVEPHSPQATP